MLNKKKKFKTFNVFNVLTLSINVLQLDYENSQV